VKAHRAFQYRVYPNDAQAKALDWTLDLTGWRHWADRFDFDADPEPLEIHFGDYSPGRFGWLLADIKALPEPIPCKGSLGLWDVPADVLAAVDVQLSAPV